MTLSSLVPLISRPITSLVSPLLPKRRPLPPSRISNMLAQYKVGRRLFTSPAAFAFEARRIKTLEPALLWRSRNALVLKSKVAENYLSRIANLSSIRTSIPGIKRYGIDANGIAFLEMSFIGVDPISKFSRQGNLSCSLYYQALQVARSLHASDLLIEDISSQSFSVDSRGQVYLVSLFGLLDLSSPSSDDSIYSVPEWGSHSARPSVLSDIFGLGCLGLLMLTGSKLPHLETEYLHRNYLDSQLRELLHAHEGVPAWSIELLLASLSWAPKERPQSVSEMLAVFPSEAKKTPRKLNIENRTNSIAAPPLLRLSRVVEAKFQGDTFLRTLIVALMIVAISIFAVLAKDYLHSSKGEAPSTTVSSAIRSADTSPFRQQQGASWKERLARAEESSKALEKTTWRDKIHAGSSSELKEYFNRGDSEAVSAAVSWPLKKRQLVSSTEKATVSKQSPSSNVKPRKGSRNVPTKEVSPRTIHPSDSKARRIENSVPKMSNSELRYFLNNAPARNEALLIAVAGEAAARSIFPPSRQMFLEILSASDDQDTPFALRRSLATSATSGPTKKRVLDLGAWTSPLAELALLTAIIDTDNEKLRLLALDLLASRPIDGEPVNGLIQFCKANLWSHRSFFVLDIGLFGLVEMLPPELGARVGVKLLPFLGAAAFDVIARAETLGDETPWCPAP